MARVRVLKRQNAAYVELPRELLNYDELELFPLKDGYYLLAVPLGEKAVERSSGISERTVLKKLLSIRFEKRSPAYVAKALSDEEKQVLLALERKGYVNVFKGDKYKEGVYNINDKVYAMLAGTESKQGNARPEAPGEGSSDLAGVLHRQGYFTTMDKNEARAISERMAQEMKSGAVVGVRGFDNKFYIVTRSYLTKAQAAITAALKEDMDAPSIASAAKLEQEGCMAVLRILSESGEIIEKKRGVFAPV